jgi:hypothetical protein
MMPTLAHLDPGGRCDERGAQQRIVGDRRSHRPAVVAQLTDLGSRFVDERQRVARDAHRAVGEEHIAGACGEDFGDRAVMHVQRMTRDEQVEPCRVASAHLEPVEGGQRHLYRPHRCERSRPGVPSGEIGDGGTGTDAVAFDGPQQVAGCGEGGVEALVDAGGRLHLGVGRIDDRGDRAESGDDRSAERGVRAQRHRAGDAAKQAVEHGEVRVGRCQTIGQRPRRIAHRSAGERRQVGQKASLGHLTKGGPSEDTDDPAHGRARVAMSTARSRAASVGDPPPSVTALRF